MDWCALADLLLYEGLPRSECDSGVVRAIVLPLAFGLPVAVLGLAVLRKRDRGSYRVCLVVLVVAIVATAATWGWWIPLVALLEQP